MFYELGVAHMTKESERVLLIAQRMDDVPFDIRAYRCILYAPGETGLRSLGNQVATAARIVAGRTYRFSVTSQEGHRTGPMFPGPDRYLYGLEVCDAMIGMGFVKCRVRVWRHGIGVDPEKVEESGTGSARTKPMISSTLGGQFAWTARRLPEHRLLLFRVVRIEAHRGCSLTSALQPTAAGAILSGRG